MNCKTWLRLPKEDERKSSQAWLALLIFTLALQVLSIWNLELSGSDSLRVAGIAREMAVTSNYLIPRLNGENFLEYPPLGYWPIAFILSMSVRPPDFLALLPIAFLGTGTVLLTFLIGRKLAGERIGLMAGFFLSTTSGFVNFHRYCRVDPSLLFFITLSLYGFAAGYRASKKSYLFSAIFYLGMAGAFFSKGIVGAAIPLGTAVVFLLVRKDLPAIKKLLLNPGMVLFFLPIFLWIGSVRRIGEFGIFEEVMRQSLFRFLSPSADHAKRFYFYFIHGITPLLPWIFLPLVLLWYRSKPIHSNEPLPHGSLLRFALVWFLVVFIGLSFASAKRALYLGPIFPPFALLAALGWDRVREKFPKVKRGEVYGLIAIFFLYVGIIHFFIIPSEREQSLRPVFEAVSSQRTHGPVYLVGHSEALPGAAFFYLGKRIPVLNLEDLLLGRFEDRPGTILVMDSSIDDNKFVLNLRLKGYCLLLEKKFRRGDVDVYSKGFSDDGGNH